MSYKLITDLSTGKGIILSNGKWSVWNTDNGPSSIADPRLMCCPCKDFCDDPPETVVVHLNVDIALPGYPDGNATYTWPDYPCSFCVPDELIGVANYSGAIGCQIHTFGLTPCTEVNGQRVVICRIIFSDGVFPSVQYIFIFTQSGFLVCAYTSSSGAFTEITGTGYLS